MPDLMNKITLPLAGLMLGLAAAGNLVSYHGAIFKILCGIIAFSLLLLLIMKIITNHKHIQDFLELLAVIFVIYVLTHYANFLFIKN